MKRFILLSQTFYQRQSTLYRLAIILFGWLVIYTVCDQFIFRQLDTQLKATKYDLVNKDAQVTYLQQQLQELEGLENSSAYKSWQSSYAKESHLQGQYKQTLSAAEQSQDIVRRILQDESNITLLQIKNSPEAEYTALSQALKRSIYQQTMNLSIQTDFFNTLRYVERLESSFPNIHWNHFKYEVTEYPLAKVEMEFMILYEKNH